jgi:hypothetical protein
MSFWDKFESKQEGIEDTIEFTIRMAVVTLAAVILVVVAAMVAGLFVSNEVVDSEKVFEIIGPAFNTIVGAFVGLLGGLSLNANARDKETPPEEPLELTVPAPEPEAPAPAPAPIVNDEVIDRGLPAGTTFFDDDDDDDDLAPWEKYRNDLRYDANGDGVVDENDFPDWRSAGK